MIYSSGLSVPEGPAWLPDGRLVCVEMGADRGCVTCLSVGGQEKQVIARTGRPNGIAVDVAGTLWVTESSDPSLLRITHDGEVEVFLNECDGDRFLWPNDICFGPDGLLYMTDSGIQIDKFLPGGELRADYMRVDIDGCVFQINPVRRSIQKIDSGIRFTNGICFGPDRALYVNETLTGIVYRYPWTKDGVPGPREEFGNVIDPEAGEGFKGPDGMKFGADGRLFVTVCGQGDVTVLAEDGWVAQRIRTAGCMPTNLAFGPKDERRIYVTEDEHGTIEVIDVDTAGFPLHMGLPD